MYVAVLGDFNDTPDSDPLAPLLAGTDLRDIATHATFNDGGRPGTFGNCTASQKIDYILLSPAPVREGHRRRNPPARRLGREERHPVAALRHSHQGDRRCVRPLRDLCRHPTEPERDHLKLNDDVATERVGSSNDREGNRNTRPGAAGHGSRRRPISRSP